MHNMLDSLFNSTYINNPINEGEQLEFRTRLN
jgi:hypothetical protein